MAAINDLLSQVQDAELRARLQAEIDRLSKQKKFGLVYEEHLPECSPLSDVPIRVGGTVALKDKKINTIYIVDEINGSEALCHNKEDLDDKQIFATDELVTVAEFGEPIYPYLKPIDTVCNAPDLDLWHTLIEADNFHALQLLEYLYAGKVDAIYIDPPYNTGARDWKYNNDYVDSSDAYRHSKWLSMMEKRLRLAKKLLNPQDSVLIVTIDEKEYLHLGCLLEDLFPEARMQMVSSVINPAAVSRDREFGRTDEYIYFIFIGRSGPAKLPLTPYWNGAVRSTVKGKLHWNALIRTGTDAQREDSPNQFYPVFVINTAEGARIHSVGDPYYGNHREEVPSPEGCSAIWPIRSNGTEGRWQLSSAALKDSIKQGFVRLGKWKDDKTAISYLKRGERLKIENGLFRIIGHRQDGSVIVDEENYTPRFIPGTAWQIPNHDASRHGSNLLNLFFTDKRFTFPKSLYAVHDALRFFVANKPNALIIDFFAGSGTTLHAVNLLNAEDGGSRRCILVTNNEVSEAESKALTKQGFRPGDEEWEALGIARYVTWPRTVCSIEGHDVNGQPLKGSYLESDLAMADGFKANAAFFKLGFLDKNAVALGRQFRELLAVLWMKAGCVGPCPSLADDEHLPDRLVLPENGFAVLLDEAQFGCFAEQVNAEASIGTVFIVTDSTGGFREMASMLDVKDCYQLYRDYLDNFRINARR